MQSLLLLHGAWHGAWCWERLIPEFAMRGMQFAAPDLPGHGARRDDRPESSADYIKAVLAAAAGFDRPPLLVCHSASGVWGSAAAEAEPDAFSGVVYIAAWIPGDGESLMTVARRYSPPPGDVQDGFSIIPSENIRPMFYADCAPEVADWAAQRVQPEPVAPGASPVQLTSARWGSLPRDYIVCNADAAVKPEAQREMARRSGCRSISEFASGHSPFLSHPGLLAYQLEILAAI